jgi:hypothetical protein
LARRGSSVIQARDGRHRMSKSQRASRQKPATGGHGIYACQGIRALVEAGHVRPARP